MKYRYEKVKKISGLIAIALLTLVAGCKDRSVGVEGYCPLPEATSPADGESGVELGTDITITFEEEINHETLNEGSFTLTGPSGEVSVTKVGYDEETFTVRFTPDQPLASGASYTGLVDNTVEDPLGNKMLEDYEWSFATETVAPNTPIVESTDPANGATGVAVDTDVSATFNMAMDASTITTTSFTLTAEGGMEVDGAVEYSNSTATFIPAADLENDVEYTATITTSAESEEGVALEGDFEWTFTTVADGATAPVVATTEPADGETGVAIDTDVNATFNMAIDASTVNTTSFTLMNEAGTEVDGTVEYGNSTATFTPAADLENGTEYTATITTDVTSEEGVALAQDTSWTFITVEEGLQAPIVDFTDPADGETDVALNKIITATFTSDTDPRDIEADLFTITFTIQDGNDEITGQVSYDGLTAIFEPNEELEPGTTYDAQITTAVEGETNQEDMEVYEWSFTTASTAGLQAPIVDFTDPADGEANVALDKTISATFTSETDPRDLELSLISATFIIEANGDTLTGPVYYDADELTAYFDPDQELEDGTIYNARIITSVKGDNNQTDSEVYEWTFATDGLQAPIVDFTDPVDGETGVALDKTISATFTPETDPRDLELDLITVIFRIENDDNGEVIEGEVYYQGLNAYFDPNVELEPGTTYNATVTTQVTGVSGIVSDEENYSWTFTTQ